jgi:DNA mismatch repair protein MutS2
VAHGFSSSGATVFVEPLEAIEANNELQNLKGKEEREVARILFALTEDLRKSASGNRSGGRSRRRTRFYQSESRICQKIQSDRADNFDDETLDLIEARHPLLEENLREANTKSCRFLSS